MSVPAPLEISVIIPVYNAAEFVGAAVHSALQFEEVREVVLVDDAGPDNSLEVCQGLAAHEPRVRLFRHPGGLNRGAGASRNLGILKSTSPYIAFLDADDFFLPGRFDAERRIFAEKSDAEGVYGAIGAHFHDPEGKVRFERYFAREGTSVRQQVPPERLLEGLAGLIPDFGHFSLDALTVKRTALDRVVPLFRPEMPLHQDTDLIFRLAWLVRLYPGSIHQPVAMRGMHAANRITANPDLDASNKVLYEGLWRWASSVGCDPRITEQFHFKYRVHAVGCAGTRGKALAIAFKHRRYFHRYLFRDALFTRLARAGTPLYRLLHKIAWRFCR